MKKVILSIALFAGLAAVSNIGANTVSNNKADIVATLQNDGFVDVKFEELNEKVQASVKALIQEYDLNSLQFNAESQITKVDATKKADQSKKVFFFDAEGKEINTEAAPEEKAEEKTEEQTPSPEMLDTTQGDGFVDAKFEELNEKVQASVKALIQEYDLNSLQFNAESQISKVDATKKADQSKKVFFFDAEGKEINAEAAPEEKVEEKTEEQAPSPEMLDTTQEDGFVDAKFEELNEKVQAAIRVIDESYDLNAIQFNADKKITKVRATKKDDQSKKTFYLDNEGVETTLEQAPQQQTEEEKVEEQK